MSLVAFLQGLADGGVVRVPALDRSNVVPTGASKPGGGGATETDREEWRDATEILRALEAAWRQTLPAGIPPLSLPAARWGARALYAACRFAVSPIWPVDEEEHPSLRGAIDRALTAGEPSASDPSIAYSADVVLRFLPDLTEIVDGLGDRGPLVDRLTALGARWPLSGASAESTASELSSFYSCLALRTVHLDRVAERGSTPRDPRVADDLRRALGLYPELVRGRTPRGVAS